MKRMLTVKLVSASSDMWNDITKTFTDLIDSMFVPLIAIATAVAVLWGIYIGLKWWRSAGDEQKRKEAKSATISFIIGLIVMFAFAVGAPMLISALNDWKDDVSIASVLPLLSAMM